MARGAFITVEGIEGVGKSSSLTVVEAAIAAAGHDVRLTREPGGTELGEQIRGWLLHGDSERPSAMVELLLMFAARGHHVDHVIEPALEQGIWVVCDRFTDATFAYQGGGRGVSPRLIESLAEAVLGGLEPDLTLLLDAPVDTGLRRIAGRSHDRFEREQRDFFERVREAYLTRHGTAQGRIRLIDASRPLDDVHTQIRAEVEQFTAARGRTA